jgi:DtxR family Mn-dependent transcriptional regulator
VTFARSCFRDLSGPFDFFAPFASSRSLRPSLSALQFGGLAARNGKDEFFREEGGDLESMGNRVFDMSKSEARSFKTLSSTAQDYLKAIFKLRAVGMEATTSVIAQRMGVTAGTVTTMLKRLHRAGLIAYAPYQAVELTPAGQQVALELIRHHRLLELYLHRAMGYRWDEVDAEAEALEHAISEEFEDRMSRLLGDPKWDPHGSPIPARDGSIEERPSVPLIDLEVGQPAVICRVSDDDAALLRYLEREGLTLQVSLRLVRKESYSGQVIVATDQGERHLSEASARSVFVTLTGTGSL